MRAGFSRSRSVTLHLLRSLHQRQHSSQEGLSLIECLVAIIIIALTVVAITPPIMLATATRVQSRRAEQANQIAQGELDRVRSIVERGGPTYAAGLLPASAGTSINNVAAAASALSSGPLLTPATCTGSRYPDTLATLTQLVRVDVNGDCQIDYAMQVFRNDGITPAGETAPYSFTMGVRVYAVYPGEATLPPLQTTRASLILGTGPRDTISPGAGQQRRPLAVLYSTLTRSDSSKSLDSLRGTTPSPSPSPTTTP